MSSGEINSKNLLGAQLRRRRRILDSQDFGLVLFLKAQGADASKDRTCDLAATGESKERRTTFLLSAAAKGPIICPHDKAKARLTFGALLTPQEIRLTH